MLAALALCCLLQLPDVLVLIAIRDRTAMLELATRATTVHRGVCEGDASGDAFAYPLEDPHPPHLWSNDL